MPTESEHRMESIERTQQLFESRLRAMESALTSFIAKQDQSNGHVKESVDNLKTEVNELNRSVQELNVDNIKHQGEIEGKLEGKNTTLKIIGWVLAALSALANLYLGLEVLRHQ